jgi:phosphate transport system regulatory protein PhoU
MQELSDRILRMSDTVQEQLTDALAAFLQHNTISAEAVIERDDVIDNQRAALEEYCFALLKRASGVLEERRVQSGLRVVANLERIGDCACHIAKHCLMLSSDGQQMTVVAMEDMAQIALPGVEECVRSFVDDDLELAKAACERERRLDELYVQRLEEVATLVDGGNVHGRTMLHTLAVLKYLEKICDFVLNIGETTFYSLTGARLTYPQFEQLESLLPDGAKSATVYRHFWDGISGATVLEVGRPGDRRVVFKEGTDQKIQEEFEKAIEWEGIAPAHTPQVIAITHARGRSGILREFAEGSLLLDLLLSESHPEQKEVLMRLVADVLTDIWRTTITARRPQIDYVNQIRARLREILRRHPRLERIARDRLVSFGGLYDLLTFLESRQALLGPPFSIWMHGDLNANNVVVDHASNSVVFIDVHRSQYGDYLQDVAVLSTSTIRKFPKGKAAKGISRANEILFEAAQDFAGINGDRNFKVRLRLARARALITSARLETDAERAQRLFIEGLELLEKVAKTLNVRRKT